MSNKIQTLSGYFHEYQKSVIKPEEFWGRIAESFHWRKAWDKVQCGNFENLNVKWFEGGKLNITENILDRHLFTKGNEAAILWEPNDPEEATRKISFFELYEMVCQMSNALVRQGVKKRRSRHYLYANGARGRSSNVGMRQNWGCALGSFCGLFIYGLSQ